MTASPFQRIPSAGCFFSSLLYQPPERPRPRSLSAEMSCTTAPPVAQGAARPRLLFSLLLLLVPSVGSACATVDRLKDPVQNNWFVEGLLNCSLISVDIPPITLTPERTAAERQLMGEEKELMPNGWLLSSSSYVPPAGDASRSLPSELRTEMRILALYDDIVVRYRYLEYLGEGRDGFLSFVPANLPGRALPMTERMRLQDIVNDVNRSRGRLYEYFAKVHPAQARAFRGSFLASAGRNEWVREADGRYLRKSAL